MRRKGWFCNGKLTETATPSEDNSDTGDNTAIVLFGSLVALSVLAAGALLIPDVRKKLFK